MNHILKNRFATLLILTTSIFTVILSTPKVNADEPVILNATAEVQINSLYAFSVTLAHPDTGWAHYADGWDVLASDGTVLGTRTLYHPHGNNEPFTRSLANIAVPIGESSVRIRSHCSVDGEAETMFLLELPPR